MKAGLLCALALVAVTGFATSADAQSAPAPGASATPKDPSLPTPKLTIHEELRYEFAPHQFGVNDVLQEIYIKLDAYTGKTWRFHASTAKWTPIGEPAGSGPLDSSEQNRYQLLTHDFYDTYGEEQELIMRVDGVSGNSWTYRGANGTWKPVEQEN